MQITHAIRWLSFILSLSFITTMLRLPGISIWEHVATGMLIAICAASIFYKRPTEK
jgi:hypothetical protein